MKRHQTFRTVMMVITVGVAPGVQANPAGLSVASGSASAVASGAQLNVTASSGAVLNWQSFNIGSGETTIFQQPSVTSVVFNQINDKNPSQIWGSLQANGIVVLENQSGFYFGPNAVVRAPGFVATTAALTPRDFGSGAFWQFNGPPPQASIINYGQIDAGKAGSVFLIAENIENHGTITAPGGNIGLVAGQQVLISERPDGRGLSAQVTLPSGSVDNSGRIIADAGTIALNAQVVNQNGIIQADSVLQQNGSIELVASDDLRLGANSQILARGADSGNSPGGSVTLKSGNNFSDENGSEIVTTGGTPGGNGGNVEISAPNILSLNSSMDASAQTGFNGGQLLLDPTEIILGTSGSGSVGNGAVTAGSSTGTLNLNVNTAFQSMNFSQITLQASDDITISPGVNWNLSASTGLTSGLLTLQAGNNIIFGSTTSTVGASIIDANNWSVNLQAGVNFATGLVQAGAAAGSGSILFEGGNYATAQTPGSFIRTAGGSITLTASQSIEVGNGWINTVGGGNILANALSGDINAGINNAGYLISSSGLVVGPTGGPSQVGGISTIGGGNVTLEAGNDVISIPNPTAKSSTITPGASGAYGGGNVTVIAGNQITGNFLVSNGTGLLEAGVAVQKDPVTGSYDATVNPAEATADIGSTQNPVTLSLIAGNWHAFAAQNIFLNEVNNPNGTFNSFNQTVPANAFAGNGDASGAITAPPAKSSFLFNYAPDSGASFWAGNSITLGAGNLFRLTSQTITSAPNKAIYPPNLALEAGAGGITFDQSIILYPSSQGSLNIVTHDGGDLNGVFVAGTGFGTGIYMSDSGLPGWSTFQTGHAVDPLYLADANDPNPAVSLNISGSINTFSLTVPTAASITAASSYNFGFTGQNLSPSAVTSINIAGDIAYRGDATSVALSDYNAAPLPADLFDNSISGDPAVTENLFYNAATGQLSFVGIMSLVGATSDLAFLLNPYIVVTYANGQQQKVPVVLSSQQQAAIEALSAASQTAVSDHSGNGIALSGPGQLNITAQNMDLGISSGIQVNQTLLPELTGISLQGASLDVTLTGDLEMTSTRIVNSGWEGAINLTAGGTVDVGQQSGILGPPNSSRGIYTSGGGDVTVMTTGDVNVDGSRIAAYDGGNVTVTSQQGDVNAGSGGNGAVTVDSVVELGPGGVLENLSSLPLYNGGVPFYGSGIMDVTPAGSSMPVGNITVSAPNGSINANVGGIEQIAFNNLATPGNYIDLTAGKDIDAGNSGVIGSDIRAKAGGNISGVFVGTGSVDINAVNNFSGTVVGSSTVAINAGGTVSGTVVGGESISVSGGDITASLVSGSVSTTGDASSASVGVPASNVPAEDAKVANDASTTATKTGDQDSDDEDDRRKRSAKNGMLATAIGRVTILLPDKK
ncbi:MAG TPA: filamentous hemagglutinin N-terminal domain-containing protein [Verrucomicrobiae bacterium]|nr:filamentous hemagglutinin N-terminal domain-containing protein [Verrucomicrobiae bacterium]